MTRAGTCLLVLALGTASARAERPQPITIAVPARAQDGVPHAGAPSSRLIYMRRCGTTGCLVHPGTDDSRTDTSMIADGQRTIGPFMQGDVVWDGLMACMRSTYAPFDISITDVDPGPVPHYEHIVGGVPQDLRNDIGNAGGVAPFTCGEIPNAISYTFDVYGPDVGSLCWTAAQETAHAFGLEHEYNGADPMSYLNGPLPKKFQATDSPCGTYDATACSCNAVGTQNSYQQILDLFGPGAPTPPEVAIKSPSEGKQVQPHFVVRVAATDDVAIDRVELWIDGVDTGVSSKLPPTYTLTAPDLAPGAHMVEARAFDVQGTPGSAVVQVDLGPPCTASKGCEGDDVCVMGLCVPGPDVSGGLGDFCQRATECVSQQCVTDDSGDMACVESCDRSAGSCPHGFACLPTGADTGVCWESSGGGCCDAGTTPTGPALLGLGLGVLLVRRRR